MAMKVRIKADIRRFRRELAAADQQRVRAAQVAARVELYRLGRVLRGDIRSGKYARPGLSAIAWWLKGRRMGTSPLMRLYPFVGYRVKTKKQGLAAEVGFVSSKVNSHWRRVILRQQAGFTARVSGRFREFLTRRGAALARSSGMARSREARYFFLRRATTSMRTPARNIIEPFWADHADEAWRNIRSNYIRKMSGDRI